MMVSNATKEKRGLRGFTFCTRVFPAVAHMRKQKNQLTLTQVLSRIWDLRIDIVIRLRDSRLAARSLDGLVLVVVLRKI